MPERAPSPGVLRIRPPVTAPGGALPAGLLSARAVVPSPPAGMVARRSLYRRLDLAATERLTLVSAGPGWGKTSTVSGWAMARSASQPVAWLTLHRGDDHPTSFWSAVLTALRNGGVHESHLDLVLGPTREMSPATMQAIYQGLVALDTPVVLVLDDFHLIRDRDVLEQVARLYEHDIPVHLMILTRTDPPLPLHRLRLSGDLCEIRADDLALTATDIADLAGSTGVQLGTDLDKDIRQRTDGWPAGARLALLHLARPGNAPDLTDFGGEDRTIGEYFAAEVLDQQPADVKRFLLLTSVSDVVCADLAEAIAPGARGQHLLEALERSNSFVTAMGPGGSWFRCHPLLRQMLAHTLARDDPSEFRAAHRRAALWFARQDEYAAALSHAIEAEDWELAGTLFVEGGFLSLVTRESGLVQALLATIPREQFDQSASLALCAFGLAFARGIPSAMASHLRSATALLEQTPREQQIATATAVGLATCAVARTRGDPAGMVVAARAALADLEDVESPPPASAPARAVLNNVLGVGLVWSGETVAAAPLLADSLHRLEVAGLTLPGLSALGHLALCEFAEGDYDGAGRHARRAVALAGPGGLTSRHQLRAALVAAAFLDVLRGDVEAADRAIAAGMAATYGADEVGPATALQVCSALAAAARGRVRGARQALDRAETLAASWAPPSFLTAWLSRARTEVWLLQAKSSSSTRAPGWSGVDEDGDATNTVCMARRWSHVGELERSGELARSVCTTAQEGTHVDLVTEVEAWLVQADVAARLGRPREALEHLGRAVELATPQQVRQPFLASASDHLPGLLRQLVTSDEARRETVRDLVTRLEGPKPSTPEPDPLFESLTERELTVLAYLPSMKTNTEIGAEMFVSVNTVKAHLKSAYRKLGVSHRRDAIRRGRELGLIS